MQRIRIASACALGAAFVIAVPGARAQQPPYMSAGWFALAAFPVPSPLSDPNHVPVVDVPAREFGNRTLVPARRKRVGFEPRIGVTAEYADNVYFTPTDRVGDMIAVASPGVNYRAETARSYFEGDYSLEGAAYASESQLSKPIEAQTGFLFWNFVPTPTTRVVVVDNLQQSEDPLGQLVPGVRPGRSTTTRNFFDGQMLWRVAPTIDLRARLGSVVQHFEDPAEVDNSQTDLEAGALMMTGARNRAGVKYRHRNADFQGAPNASTDTVAAEDEFSLSPLVTVRGLAGVASVQGASVDQRTVLGAALIATTRDALMGLSFDQDVRTAGGLGSLFFARTATASARWRLASRWYLSGAVSFSTYESLGTDGLEIDVWEPRVTLSYTVSPGVVVAARYIHVEQQPNVGPATQASRIGVTLAFSF